jgi:hypothetical protein
MARTDLDHRRRWYIVPDRLAAQTESGNPRAFASQLPSGYVITQTFHSDSRNETWFEVWHPTFAAFVSGEDDDYEEIIVTTL